MARFSLHAVGQDQPGIVATVTQALADLGCNLEDSRMTALHGQFAIVLVLEAPGIDNGMAIEEVLVPAIEELGLQLLVRPIPDELPNSEIGELIAISLRGADHPGMVARVARAVAAAGGNVVDLVGHVADDDAETPSLLELTVSLASAESLAVLRTRLFQLAEEIGVRCEISQPLTPHLR